MRKVMMAVMAVTFFMAANVLAQPVLIKGYGPKQYAVVGDIEDQARIFAEGEADKKPSRILVEGMADKSGDKAGNEEFGSKRANDMKAYLEIKFPNAKIIPRSLGDTENARQVRLTVLDYVPAPAPLPVIVAKELSEQEIEKVVTKTITQMAKKEAAEVVEIPAITPKPKPSMRLKILVSGVVVLISLLTIIFFSVIMRRKRKNKEAKAKVEAEAKAKTEPEVDPFPDTTISTVPIEIIIAGETYRHYPEVTGDGRYKTFHELESGKFRFASNEKDWRRSVRSTLNKNAEMVKKLVDCRVLQPIS